MITLNAKLCSYSYVCIHINKEIDLNKQLSSRSDIIKRLMKPIIKNIVIFFMYSTFQSKFALNLQDELHASKLSQLAKQK